MKYFITLFSICFSFSVFAEERARVTIPSEEETSVKYMLENLENSINNQDYISYMSCFDDNFRKKEEIIINMFLEDHISFQINKFIVTKQTDSNVEVYVKYSLTVGEYCYDIISLLNAKIKDGEIKIASEKIKKYDVLELVSNKPKKEETFNARNRNNFAVADDQEQTEDLFLFNDADGNPNPDGIMWIDPEVLARVRNKKTCRNCR